MNEQELRSEFFAKTGRVATSEPVEYQAFLWGFTTAAASRNAEVAELKKELYAISVAIDDPRTDLTMTMVEVITDQHKERDHLREQVKMLRDALKNMCMSVLNESGALAQFNDLYKSAEEALAATEPTSIPTDT